MLKVEAVNFHESFNGKNHRTNRFEISSDSHDSTPVLRRGQPFRLSITFDRSFQEHTDIVKVYFRCVDVEERSPRNIAAPAHCTVTRGNQISRDNRIWSLALLSQETNQIHLNMKSPSNIPFATYKLYIDTKNKRKPGIKKYQHEKLAYFLFNPWEKDDEVYMPDTKVLDEYILNDIGKIYTGSSTRPNGVPWVFGQFAKPVLPALLHALKDSSLNFSKRGNPVHLARALTSLLCSSDPEEDQGVLKVTKEGVHPYSDCTDPTLWNDSVTIFDEYLKSGGKPVKYGKCWVFSGLTTTACRAIGIPCRSITNYESANDADDSMAVETYTVTEGAIIDEEKESEDIWAFHCWNDVWMTRNDLPSGYGGWQAIDSSPIRLDFDGINACGPASLVAIKNGEINHKYNTQFITAEVNADVINYVAGEDDFGDMTYIPSYIDTKRIGKVILTKKPYIYDPNGDSDIEDITNQYKEKEGTKEERLAFFNALRQSDYKSDAYNIESAFFVEFHLSEIENIDIGEDIEINLDIKNGSISERKIEALIVTSSIYYNGVKGNQIKKISDKLLIQPDKCGVVKMRISAEEYAPHLVEHAFVKVLALAKIADVNYFWSGEDHFVINLPEIAVSTKADLKKDKQGTLIFTIKNPLKRRLTGCKFIYEAAGIAKHTTVSCRDILPEEEVSFEYSVIPNRKCKTFVAVKFESNQLHCVTGRGALSIN